jgi:group I intron endonuclease
MKKEKVCGIYCIKNIVNNKIYIGQSSDLDCRFYMHFYELKRNSHRNTHLQNAFNKYGEENFEFKIILYCEPEELTYYEQSLVDLWNPEYNICKECVNTRIGTKVSEESLIRMSIAQSGENNPNFGKPRSEETKKKISDANKGRIVPDDERAKALAATPRGENHPNFGKPVPEERRKRISETEKGKVVSEETRKKMSESTSGENHPMFNKHHSEETRNKISESSKGKKMSDVAREKMSMNMRKRWYIKKLGVSKDYFDDMT